MKKQQVKMVGSVLTVEYPTIGKTFTADVSKYPAAVQAAALAHGYSQKFGDAKSGQTALEKFEMVKRIHESLMAGSWKLAAGPQDNSAIIIEAVSRIKKIKIEKIEKTLVPLTEEDRATRVKGWADNATVKAEIAKIRAERAAKAAEDDDEELDIEV